MPEPSSLPRFDLDLAPPDSADVLATRPRPAIRKRSSTLPPSWKAPAIRKRADSTNEVAVEDILIEVFCEEPEPASNKAPPVSQRATRPAPYSPSLAPSLAKPERHDSSLPYFAQPTPPPQRPETPFQPLSLSYEPPLRVSFPEIAHPPSIAPVAISLAYPEPPPAPPYPFLPELSASLSVPPPKSRGGVGIAIALFSVAALAIAAAVVVVVRPDTLARARLAIGGIEGGTAKSTIATSPADPPPPPPPAPPPPAPSAPGTSVGALPSPSIAANMTEVTLPPSAHGHRVFVDGRVVDTRSSPLVLKCGGHVVRIGTGGRVRHVRLPCGGELALK
jgi:hypothetical protein